MSADASRGGKKAPYPTVRVLTPLHLAEVAEERAIPPKHPQELPPGKSPVFLDLAAVLDMVGFMFWDWGGQAILDERSFLNNRIGTQLFGQNISVTDDAYHPLQSGAPFDGEGVRRQKVTLVENGIPKRLVYARGTD